MLGNRRGEVDAPESVEVKVLARLRNKLVILKNQRVERPQQLFRLRLRETITAIEHILQLEHEASQLALLELLSLLGLLDLPD